VAKQKLMKLLAGLSIVALLVVAFIGAAWSAVEEAPSSAPGPKSDARRLRTGRFTYRELNRGKDVGRGRIEIRKIPDSEKFSFSAEITGEFGQCWESLATSAFEPISAKLSFGQSPCNVSAFEIAYNSGRVTGFSVPRDAGPARTRRSLDASVPAGVVDQRIDWATVLAADFENEKNFEFRVYDPGTGVSRVAAQVEGIERVQVPAGSFEVCRITYRMAKASGVETYVVFATRGVDRMMVREDFSNGFASELIEVAER
jgi:hypothetical protein